MSTLNKAIAILTTNERKRGLLVLVLVMGMAILDTAGVASLMPFLALLGNPQMIETNSFVNYLYSTAQDLGVQNPDEFFILLGIGTFLLIITSTIYRTYTHYVMNHFIEMIRHSLGVRLLETYLRQPYAFFLNRHSAELSKTILSEVDHFIANVLHPVYSMIAYTLVLIAITALLVLVNPLLAFLSAGVLGTLYIILFFGLKLKLTNMGNVLVSSNKERFKTAGEALGSVKEIKLLGREHTYLNRFSTPSKQFAYTHAMHNTLNQVPKYLIEALAFGGVIAIIVFLMLTSGGLSNNSLGHILPIVGLYAFAAYRIQPALQFIFSGFASLRYGKAAVDNLYADLYSDNDLEQLTQTEPIQIKANDSITMQHLSYVYPNSERPSLSDLNLQIPIGSAIGLIGSTGAGKTTLVDIFLGLLRPTSGEILIDGERLTDIQVRAWQGLLGYVPQDIFLADTSVTENIALGVPHRQIDQKQVIASAKMAQVHDFIMEELPDQYDSMVGERGVRLSGGQRQRIGIARALYHNPEIIVFDEATSALDTVTEQAVMGSIDNLLHKKTIIIIAHRLSTVRKCDQIVLLEKGIIKAKGSYSKLFKTSEQFRLMAEGINK